MSVPFTFPVSTDDFAVYQEQLMGRSMSDQERDTLNVWVPIINDSFRDGQLRDQDTLTESQVYLSQLEMKHKENKTLVRFLQSVQHWILYAWNQGAAAK